MHFKTTETVNFSPNNYLFHLNLLLFQLIKHAIIIAKLKKMFKKFMHLVQNNFIIIL